MRRPGKAPFRALTITLPTGGKQIYLFDAQILALPTDWPSELVPNIPMLETLDVGARHTRNSYFWNALQSQNLSTNLSEVVASTNSLKLGRLRHWLVDQWSEYEGFPLSTLSLEQAPSSDGSLEGQVTRYHYTGKSDEPGYSIERGDQVLPGAAFAVQADALRCLATGEATERDLVGPGVLRRARAQRQ